VFHVLVLKKCEGHPQPACVPKPLLLNDKGHLLQPQVVLSNRIIKKNDKWQEEVLIDWKCLTPDEAIWERYADIQSQYPTFNLEDKVILNGGGNGISKGRNSVKGEGHSAGDLRKKGGKGSVS